MEQWESIGFSGVHTDCINGTHELHLREALPQEHGCAPKEMVPYFFTFFVSLEGEEDEAFFGEITFAFGISFVFDDEAFLGACVFFDEGFLGLAWVTGVGTSGVESDATFFCESKVFIEASRHCAPMDGIHSIEARKSDEEPL